MKSISEHLKSLPEPYSTLALRRVVAGRGDHERINVGGALMSAFSWATTEEERLFWNQVYETTVDSRRPLPEIPAFLLAELEPAPAAPACVFEVGKVYKTRRDQERKVAAIDDHPQMPLIVTDVGSDGVARSDLSRMRLSGRYFTDRDTSDDLIPPAPPKRVVPLGPKDCPPGSVFRCPVFPDGVHMGMLGVADSGILTANYRELPECFVEHVNWEDLQAGYEILLPGSTVWQKCEKEVDA